MTARSPLRVVASQVLPPTSVEVGLRQVADVVDRVGASGTDLVVLPELALTGYDLDRLAEPTSWIGADDSRLDRLRDRCRTLDFMLVLGVAHLADDGRRLLAAMCIDPAGDIAISPKQHLHGRERELFDPGEPISPVDLRGWRLGLAVCFDAAVPSHAQHAADAGAEVYVVSAFYAATEFERMGIHLAARAMDHRMYSVVANFAAAGGTIGSCGGSGVWGPDGRCLVRAGADVAVVATQVDPVEIARLRASDRSATR